MMYEVRSSFMWDGRRLAVGDRLSKDEILRRAPHQFGTMVRTRMIAEVAAKVPSTKAEWKAAAEAAGLDVPSNATKADIQALLEEHDG